MATTLSIEPHYPDFFKPGNQLDSFAETFPPDPDPEVCPLFIDYNRVDISPATYFEVGIWGFGDFQIPPALKNQIPRNRQYVIPSAAGLVAWAAADPRNKAVGQLTQSDINTYVDAVVDVHVGLILDQFSESGMTEDSDQYHWYYQRVRQNIDAAYQAGMITKKPFVGGGYTGPSSPSAQNNRFTAQDSHIRNPLGRRFTDPARPLPEYYDADNAFGFCHYYRAGRQNFMGTNAGTYQASPGWVDDFYEWLNGVFIALLNKGKYTPEQLAVASLGFFNWELTGDSRDAFATDWEMATTNPEGRALTAQRIPIAPTMGEAMGYITGFFLEWGVLWDEGNKRISDPNAIDSYKPGGEPSEQSVIWFSKAEPTVEKTGLGAFPFKNSSYVYNRPKGPKNGRDFFYLGYRKGKAMRKLFTKSQFSFVDYSLDGGAYVTAQAGGKEVLQAASGFRRIVMRFDDGTNFRFVDFNPYGDSLGHTITAKRANGAEYTFPVIDGLLNITGLPTTTAPGTPTAFAISGSYNRSTHRLSLSGAGASGPISYQVPSTTNGYELQPDGGFLIPEIIRGSTISIQGRTGSGQTAQTQLAIPVDVVTDPTAPIPVVNTSPLPEVLIGHYSLNMNNVDYGAGNTEDYNRYEWLGLRPVENGDGITIAGQPKDANNNDRYWFPPYIKEFCELARSLNVPDAIGIYVTVLWAHINSPLKKDQPWVPHVSDAWKRYMNNVFAYLKANDMKGGLGIWAGRDANYDQFILPTERGYDSQGRVSDAGTIVPAIRLFAQLLGYDVNDIPTDTAAGRFLTDEKPALRHMRPFQVDGSLTFIMLGTHTNGELGYDTRQNDPAGSWTDFHPDELAKLRAYLKKKYNNNLQTLSQAWFNNPSAYSDWNQVNLPFTGDYYDFRGQRGLDCQEFRHIQIGDAIEVMCRLVWSELSGILIIIQFGQPFGGQSGILATMDVVYLAKRAAAVAVELGLDPKTCVGMKYNPIVENENHQMRGSYMKYMCDDAVGSSQILHEDSYEADRLTATAGTDPANFSGRMADAAAGARTGRAGDSVGMTAVLSRPSGGRIAGRTASATRPTPTPA